jgi:hypothetical protein
MDDGNCQLQVFIKKRIGIFSSSIYITYVKYFFKAKDSRFDIRYCYGHRYHMTDRVLLGSVPRSNPAGVRIKAFGLMSNDTGRFSSKRTAGKKFRLSALDANHRPQPRNLS